MKMPAVTIVAAWISAEIGVGPSIESGSQTCSGTCALLPIAPMKRQMHMIDNSDQSAAPARWSVVDSKFFACANTGAYSSVPKYATMRPMPSTKPKSPTRFARNAFRLA